MAMAKAAAKLDEEETKVSIISSRLHKEQAKFSDLTNPFAENDRQLERPITRVQNIESKYDREIIESFNDSSESLLHSLNTILIPSSQNNTLEERIAD